MDTIQDFAALLNGREYKKEMTPEEIEAARKAGIVIVYGFSDDTTLIHGAIEESVSTVNGAQFYLTPTGLFEECPCDCKYSREAKQKAKALEAIWCKGPYVWHYETKIPHVTFEIIDNQPADNLKFCQGIVFELKALSE
jgi:hypothetical protein